MKYRNGTSGHGFSLECWVLPTEERPPKRGQTWVTSLLERTQQETPPAPSPDSAKSIGSTSKAPGHISPPPSPRGVALGDTGQGGTGSAGGTAGLKDWRALFPPKGFCVIQVSCSVFPPPGNSAPLGLTPCPKSVEFPPSVRDEALSLWASYHQRKACFGRG